MNMCFNENNKKKSYVTMFNLILWYSWNYEWESLQKFDVLAL